MPEETPQGGNEQQLQALLDKHKGDAMGLAMQLYTDNFKLRDKNRELRDKVPAEGSVVLTKEQGAEYEAAKGVMQILADLKVKPEELKEKFEGAAAENAKLKREGMRHALVELGYSSQALADFDALEGASIESYTAKDEKKDGKDVKVAYVTVGGKELPFDDYAKQKRPALASVLKSDTAAQGGVAYVPQSPGGRPPANDKYEDIRKDVKRREEARQGKTSELHPIFQPPQQAAAS